MLPWRRQSKTPQGQQQGGEDKDWFLYLRSQSAAARPQLTQGGGQLKRKLLSALQEAVSELQYDRRGDQTAAIPTNELSGRLVSVLEAVFIHGLKETFLGRLTARLQDSASPRMPEPSFWTFCLVFSHKAVIGQVESLGQVASEVGRSRAWLRLALNDGLLASYLAAMAKDHVSLSVHYEKFAFLRDGEMRDLLLTYLTGVEVYTFALSTNASLLNRWQAGPLVLAGLWAPALPSSLVEGAQDVAAALEEDSRQLQGPAFSRTLAEPIHSPTTSYMRQGLLNEDEALRLILASTPLVFTPPALLSPTAQPSSPACLSPAPPSRSPSPEPWLQEDRSVTVSPTLHWDTTNSYLLGGQVDSLSPDSLARELDRVQLQGAHQAGGQGGGRRPETPASGPVGALEDIEDSNEPEYMEDVMRVEAVTAPDEKQDTVEVLDEAGELVEKRDDYDGLAGAPPEPAVLSGSSSACSLASCCCSSAGPDPSCRHCSSCQPRPQLLASPPPGRHQGDLISLQQCRERRLGHLSLGFSQPPALRVPSLSLTQNISLTAALDVITHEVGLESQDWRCHDCGAAIGAIFGPWQVCHYTSRYHCSDCQGPHRDVIPSRLLYNWDAAPRPVSRAAHTFLAHIAAKPLVNISTFNPSLAKIAPGLEEAARLRKQLTYLVAYLAACTRAQAEGVKVCLAEVVWPREYLYTGTDTYSLQDLEQLHRGELRDTLEAGVKVCSRHVLSCLVCSGRGFICEVCGDRRPVYPFHLDTTSQCQECQTVFHLACARSVTSCPKCERMAARSLNTLVMDSKLARETGEGGRV